MALSEKTHHTKSAQETRALGKEIAKMLQPESLLAFTGELGAGKTTFIQGILEGVGAKRPFVSPTFVLMKQYDLQEPTATGIRRVYHADAYRVGEKDFSNIGFSEWLTDPEGVVLLEWPERIQGILPEKKTLITLKNLSESEREITIAG